MLNPEVDDGCDKVGFNIFYFGLQCFFTGFLQVSSSSRTGGVLENTCGGCVCDFVLSLFLLPGFT